MMRQRRSPPARLTHVATIGDVVPTDRVWRKPLLLITAITGVMLAVFFVGKHWLPRILASQWQQGLETVADERAEMLVASAARLGRPGLPVLVAALKSPRESVSSAGRIWLEREMRSWENLPNREAQRNVASLAEALASEVDNLDPATRLVAARLANRLLRWRLDGNIVDRGRVTWLCDRILHAADYTVAATVSSAADASDDEKPGTPQDEDPTFTTAVELPPPRPLEIPEIPQEAPVRSPFAAQTNQATSPNIVPLPNVKDKTTPPDLADAWAMRGHALRAKTPQKSEIRVYPDTSERVFIPTSPEGGTSSPEPAIPVHEMSLTECMKRLHAPGFDSLAAEDELKRRGFNPLQLSIARRVYDPDRRVRLKLVRELPGLPGIGATDWLLKMAADEHEEVRLEAITLLATLGDPAVLGQVESMARHDPSEKIRTQAERLARKRQLRR